MELLNTPERTNNFNLIRIIAALQVVLFHGYEHLSIENTQLNFLIEKFLRFFPGVPIFFFVSGLLIYWSYSRNVGNLKKYFKNRFLRLYPGLWACLALTIVLLVSFSFYLNNLTILKQQELYLWIIGQASFFQFYTPESLRFWGVGTPNGSLWTIIIEVQFYLIVPIIFKLLKRNKGFSLLIIIISLVSSFFIGNLDPESMQRKLGGIIILPYLYYFMFGVLSFIYWEKIKQVIQGKFLLILIIFILWSTLFSEFTNYNTYTYWVENPFKIVSDILLLLLTLSFSITKPTLSQKLLKENDISYGVYIYHMLIINTLVSLNLTHNVSYLFITLVATTLLAYLSWVLIEKPALKRK